MYKYLSLIFVLTVVFSCKKKTDIVNLHFDYFGVHEGRYIIYDAKEIAHLSNGTSDTIRYQLKTIIGDTVLDNSGRIGHKYYRYKRNNSAENWNLSDVWFIILTDNRGELIEENERIIKLVFAPTDSKTWNGNAFNTTPEMEYSYEDIHTSMNINGIQVDSTLKVVQEDVFNLIQWRKKSEIYAKNIGMVKKHYQHLNITNFDITNISTGKELFLEMIDYGIK
jgi:hypothetical protein